MYHALRPLEEATWGYMSRNWLSPIIPLRSVNRWKAFTVYSWSSRAAAGANLDWVVIMRQLPSEFFTRIRSFNSHNSQVDTVIVSILLKKTLWHRRLGRLYMVPLTLRTKMPSPPPPPPRGKLRVKWTFWKFMWWHCEGQQPHLTQYMCAVVGTEALVLKPVALLCTSAVSFWSCGERCLAQTKNTSRKAACLLRTPERKWQAE